VTEPRRSAPREGPSPRVAATLAVRDLVVRYGDLEVLHDVTLEASEGEIVAVIGPNGAGKTTLLRTLAGVRAPARGEVTFAGEPIHRRPAWDVVRRGVVLVPEGRGIFADQTVRDNLLLGAVSRRTFDELDRVLDRFPQLRPRLDGPAGALSGGQQQMLAIARGLMARPRLIMLDEPSLGLAPRLVRDVFAAVRAIRADGVGVVLVEQMAAVALEAADRAYVLDRGRIVAHGAARDLASDSRVIAAYLGRPNQPG
jgi:branched-chain amino acid transport system ATP-binding protein/branched-chain amino acid transport system permease protein